MLDLSATAEKYLYKQLARTKRIAECPAFERLQNVVKVSLSGPQDIAEANVTARLFRSNPVKNALPGIMAGIRQLLGLDDVKDQNGKQHSKGEDSKKRTVKEMDTSAKRLFIPSEQPDISQIQVENLSMDDKAPITGSLYNDNGIDYSDFKGRLASSSEDDNENDDDESGGEELVKARHRRKPQYNAAMSVSTSSPPQSDSESDSVLSHSLSASESISASVSESELPSSRSSRSRAKSKPVSETKSSSTKSTATKTTFLPSLMMGGYWSGSDSDENDPAPDFSDQGGGQTQRKNRRGQRARQAIWEKKYGTKAKHLSKPKIDQKSQSNLSQTLPRDRGWDLRKGATDENDNGRLKGKPWIRGGHREKGNVSKSGVGVNRASNKSSIYDGRGQHLKNGNSADKPLHPSWEAARRAKEQKAQASFQGKKITFD